MGIPSIEEIILRLVVILPALTFHEFAHAYAANRLGDPTARLRGRLTLNPLAHIDPIGTILVPIFIRFGWAKPVPINPANFRDPGRGSVIVSLAGPGANIVQALFLALVFRAAVLVLPSPVTGRVGPLVLELLVWMTAVNLMLAFFNLIPLGPLDGHWVLDHYLPYEQKMKYRQFNQYGMFILLGVLFLFPEVLQAVVFTPALFITRLLIGGGP